MSVSDTVSQLICESLRERVTYRDADKYENCDSICHVCRRKGVESTVWITKGNKVKMLYTGGKRRKIVVKM